MGFYQFLEIWCFFSMFELRSHLISCLGFCQQCLPSFSAMFCRSLTVGGICNVFWTSSACMNRWKHFDLDIISLAFKRNFVQRLTDTHAALYILCRYLFCLDHWYNLSILHQVFHNYWKMISSSCYRKWFNSNIRWTKLLLTKMGVLTLVPVHAHIRSLEQYEHFFADVSVRAPTLHAAFIDKLCHLFHRADVALASFDPDTHLHTISCCASLNIPLNILCQLF